ncbi:MAG: YdcF family protein [Butyrivibrio sp.]|nr:YdcF family protein [Butyrivibrio sp.]
MSNSYVNKRSLNDIGQFIFVEDGLDKADIIIVPGAPEPLLAVQAARLWKSRYAPFVLVSGKFSYKNNSFEEEAKNLEEINLPATEAEYLASVLLREGVRKSNILVENNSTNTFENARYCAAMLKGNDLKRIILCCQAFHARRALMTFQSEFPGVEVLVAPVNTKNIMYNNWYETEEGYNLVMGELIKCGKYFTVDGMFQKIFYKNN